MEARAARHNLDRKQTSARSNKTRSQSIYCAPIGYLHVSRELGNDPATAAWQAAHPVKPFHRGELTQQSKIDKIMKSLPSRRPNEGYTRDANGQLRNSPQRAQYSRRSTDPQRSRV